MLEAHLDMACSTLIHQTILSPGTLTMILHVVLMIGKAHLLSIWVQI